MSRWARRLWWVAPLLSVVSLAGGSSHMRVADAVEQRDKNAVEALLKQRADVNQPQPDGATALHWAAHWDDASTVDLLIRAGANVNAANDLGATPLYLACINANAAIVARLLTAGANPNAALPSGETVLMTAARTGNVDVVKVLLVRKADVNAKDNVRGQTALMWAVSEQHRDIVRVLIDRGADVNAHSKGEFTPLLFAAREGDLESGRMLLAAGAKVNDSAPDGSAPLLVASLSVAAIASSNYKLTVSPSDHEKLAISLLENGADTAKTDSLGRTPLHAAVETRRVELVKALLAHGANPNAQMVKDEPPLRGDFNARNGYVGATPFWLAARASDLELMRILVAGGANPNLATRDNVTPLMVAAGANQNESRLPPESQVREAVQLCLQLGNDINATSRDGQNSVHIATAMGEDAIIQFLFDHGAKVDVKDRQGRTPLDVALTNPSRPRPKSAALLRSLLGGSNPISQ